MAMPGYARDGTANALGRFDDNAAKRAEVEAGAKGLESLLSELQARIAFIGEGVSRLHSFKHRLLMARPEAAGSTAGQAPKPNSDTIEGKLHSLVEISGHIGERLISVCNDLDRAA